MLKWSITTTRGESPRHEEPKMVHADDYNDPNLPGIDQIVIDPDGQRGRIVQIVECGEVAIVNYSDYDEDLFDCEWDLLDLQRADA